MGSKACFISGTLLALCRKLLADLNDVRPNNCGGGLLESERAKRRFHLRFSFSRSHLMAKKKSAKKSSSGGSKKGSRKKKTVAGRVSAMMNSAGKGIASAARAATKAVTGKKRKTAKKKK
jgi:hypothetical protein